jgi:hypothetical protein
LRFRSAHVIASLIVGAATIIAFVLYENYMPLKQPLLPLRLFRHRNLIYVGIIGCVGQMVYYALNVLFPQQITQLYTTDNIIIGAMSSTVGASLALGEFAFSPMFKKVGQHKWQLLAAVLGTGGFCAAMAAQTQSTLGMAVAVS